MPFTLKGKRAQDQPEEELEFDDKWPAQLRTILQDEDWNAIRYLHSLKKKDAALEPLAAAMRDDKELYTDIIRKNADFFLQKVFTIYNARD